jgi:hypothetical protein
MVTAFQGPLQAINCLVKQANEVKRNDPTRSIPDILTSLASTTQTYCKDRNLSVSLHLVTESFKEGEKDLMKLTKEIAAVSLKAILENCDSEECQNLEEIQALREGRAQYQALIKDLNPKNIKEFELKESPDLIPEPLPQEVKTNIKNIINSHNKDQEKCQKQIKRNSIIIGILIGSTILGIGLGMVAMISGIAITVQGLEQSLADHF